MKQSGFTLVELLVSIVIFTGIMGTFFSVVASVQRTEAFRTNSTTLTQAASYGFEPIVRSIKEADGIECIRSANEFGVTDNYLVRGFYLRGGYIGKEVSGSLTLTTLFKEKHVDANNTTTNFLVRRDYAVSNNVISETTYQIKASDAESNERDCTPLVWANPTSRNLTGSDVQVKILSFRVVAPLLNDQMPAGTNRQSPFASIQLTVDYKQAKAGIAPVSFQTTATPTFSYGERRE